jgi:hypothetical protein
MIPEFVVEHGSRIVDPPFTCSETILFYVVLAIAFAITVTILRSAAK